MLWKLRLAGQIDDPDAREALLDGMVDATAKATRVLTLQNPFLQISRTPAVRLAVRQSWVGMLLVPVLPDALRSGQSLPDASVYLVRPDRVVAADGASVDAVWRALPHAVTL